MGRKRVLAVSVVVLAAGLNAVPATGQMETARTEQGVVCLLVLDNLLESMRPCANLGEIGKRNKASTSSRLFLCSYNEAKF